MKGFCKKSWKKNNIWNIRRLVDDSFVPSSKRPSIWYCKLTNFNWERSRQKLTFSLYKNCTCTNWPASKIQNYLVVLHKLRLNGLHSQNSWLLFVSFNLELDRTWPTFCVFVCFERRILFHFSKIFYVCWFLYFFFFLENFNWLTKYLSVTSFHIFESQEFVQIWKKSYYPWQDSNLQSLGS